MIGIRRTEDGGRKASISAPTTLRRRVAVGMALLLGIAMISDTPVHGRSRRAKRTALTSRLQSLKEDTRETRAELRETKSQQRDVIGELHVVQDNMERTNRQIERSETRLERINADLEATRSRLEETREKLEEDRGRLARRIVAARQSGDNGYLTVALGAQDFNDFLRREAFVERIVQSDVELIRSVREQVAQVRADEAKIETQQAAQEQVRSALAQQREEHRREYARQAAIYQQLKEQRAELEAAYAQLERDSENVRTMLEQLIRTPEGQARAAVRWTGSFARPVSGRMTSRFGRRFHPVLHRWKLHTGVDFAAPTGTPVHAASAGVVVHSGWLGAYGYTVILDHGGGVSTLYGHNSSLTVVVGQSVGAGQVIARSGSTGYSTGPHVHFEKRVNGSPVPPF